MKQTPSWEVDSLPQVHKIDLILRGLEPNYYIHIAAVWTYREPAEANPKQFITSRWNVIYVQLSL